MTLPWNYDYQFRPPEPDIKVYRCPVCGAVCEKIYRNAEEIIGCDECVEKVDAEDVLDGE